MPGKSAPGAFADPRERRPATGESLPRMLRQRNVLAGLVAVSLAAVVAFPLFTAFYLAPSFSRLIIEGAQREAERTAAHLAEPFLDASGLVRPEQVTAAFRETVAGHLRNFKLEKLKVFAPSGEIVFSTDPAEEGMVNQKPYFREMVAAGRTHTNVVRKGDPTQEGRRAQADVVETYVPLMRGGRFAGAFEIYYDITARTEEMSRLLGRSNLIVLLMAGGFLAAVVLSSLRAGRAVRERDRAAEALREQRDRLEVEVAERTASLRESKEALERDVASRILAEEALRESQERALAIAGSSMDAIFVLDGAGRVSYLNRAAEEMYGYPRDEVLGCVFHEVFVAEGARAHYGRLLPEFRETGKCPVMGGIRQYPARRRDGTVFPAELCVVPVRIRGEWHAVGTMRDIGERRRAEEERERLIAELTDALDNIKALSGIVPVCSSCKKLRDDKGYWSRVEEFLAQHAEVQVSQGLCPDCSRRLYPDSPPGEGQESPLLPLSRREREVLSWLRHGKSNWEISRILGISERTVKFHVTSIMRKLNAVTRTQAVALAMELGILEETGGEPQVPDQG